MILTRGQAFLCPGALIFCAVLSGCTGGAAKIGDGASGIARTVETEHGTILVVRPVLLPAANGGVAALALAPFGGVAIIAANDASAHWSAPVELVIRKDAGGLISIVQNGASRFTPGQVVVIIHSGRTHVAPV
jgi:outer membrane lipoprotein SlyB